MKKQLLCTSAIALGVAAAPAMAQDWSLDWGGYYNTHVVYNDYGGNALTALAPGVDVDGINMFTNGEIIFTPSVTLDNGMTFGINVQMEALNAGGGADGIDESYMSISSDTFGRLDIGHENSVGYKMMVAAPSVGLAINSGSTTGFLPSVATAAFPGFRQAALSSYTEVAGNNDVMRLSYYTPSFNGLTLGVSYAPSAAGNAANNAPVNRGTAGGVTDIWDIAVGYSQSFGTTDVNLAARWGKGDNQDVGGADPETWGVGASVGFNGFTVGGAYAENSTTSNIGVNDSEGWSFGVAYDMAGPWTFGAELYMGEADTDGVAGADKAEYQAYKIAGTRDLGPGVSWSLYAVIAEASTTVAGSKTKVDSTAIGSSINLSF